MTERGHPTEGAPACPFVAFEDDRDARSTVPDHRHRCFAEARPAPRALAHQEAYCLSSAFPVCPTFQDWARREAAAARPQPAASSLPPEEPPESRPMPPLEREPQHASSDVPAAIPPRRNIPRDWAAPPPWTGDEEPDGAGIAGVAGAAAAGATAASAGYGSGYGSDLDPYAAQGDVPLPSRPRTPADDVDAESRGLAGSAAYRLAGPDPDEPYAATPQGDPYAPPAEEAMDDDDDGAWSPAGPAAAAAASTAWAAPSPAHGTSSTGRPARPPARGAPPRTARPPQASKPPAGPQEPSELFGPAWERPRRYEAYPTLRTRIGLPSFGGVSRLATAALALVLAALFLFFFGPMILGFGKNDPGVGSGTSPRPSVVATATPEPTAVPAPTPQVYIVARGDTMSKIAKKFGLTVEDLQNANPKIKNPDKIKIGDKIIIPVPVDDSGESAQP